MSVKLLKSIIGSKTRLKLLRIFLWNEEVEFYLRELQSLLHEDLTAIRREVTKLHEEKLLRKVTRGNRIYYQINASHAFFAPLRELFFQSEHVRGELVKIISDKISLLKNTRENFDQVILYGDDCDLLEKKIWQMLFVGNISNEKMSNIVAAIEQKLKKSVRHKFLSKVDFDVQMEGEAHALDEIFTGQMIEIKRNGIYL